VSYYCLICGTQKASIDSACVRHVHPRLNVIYLRTSHALAQSQSTYAADESWLSFTAMRPLAIPREPIKLWWLYGHCGHQWSTHKPCGAALLHIFTVISAGNDVTACLSSIALSSDASIP